MTWKLLPLLILCGTLSAANLPDGWQPYMSVKDAEPGTVTLQDNNMIRVVDPGTGVEAGISKIIPCAPGDYIRVTADIKPAGKLPLSTASISAFYRTKPAKKAGAAGIPLKSGHGVLTVGPVPEGVTNVQIFVYSSRKIANDFLTAVPKVEIAKTPFEK